jgi:hypothetical protein
MAKRKLPGNYLTKSGLGLKSGRPRDKFERRLLAKAREKIGLFRSHNQNTER